MQSNYANSYYIHFKKNVWLTYKELGICKNIKNIQIDKETGQKSLIIEFVDGSKEFLPYDQPLYLAQDSDYMLHSTIENVVVCLKEELLHKKISKKKLAQKLHISEQQIQKLLNPHVLNKNLKQLYQLADFLKLKIQIKVA